jgi:hypothetical protein
MNRNRNRNRMMLLWIVLAGCAAIPIPAGAHHGAAAYDMDRISTMPATVTALDWRNPHALLLFDVPDDDGRATAWTAETAGLVILIRAGWTRDVVKAGDRVMVAGHPAMNGSHTMLLKRLVLPSGRELTSIVPPR